METLEEAEQKGLEHLGNAIDKFQDSDLDIETLSELERISTKINSNSEGKEGYWFCENCGKRTNVLVGINEFEIDSKTRLEEVKSEILYNGIVRCIDCDGKNVVWK